MAAQGLDWYLGENLWNFFQETEFVVVHSDSITADLAKLGKWLLGRDFKRAQRAAKAALAGQDEGINGRRNVALDWQQHHAHPLTKGQMHSLRTALAREYEILGKLEAKAHRVDRDRGSYFWQQPSGSDTPGVGDVSAPAL